MSEGELFYRVEKNVGYFTINREAKRNSISPDVITSFLKYLDEAEADAEVRAVCVTGAGDRAFCSGADLGGAIEGGETGASGFSYYAKLLKRIASFPKPTVARVNGYCLAGGMGFMLACDIVIATKDAKFGTPEVNVGLWPMMIGALIFRNAPRKKAMEMILLGEKLGADKAVEMGLITRAVPRDKLDDEVGGVLAGLAGKSPIGMKIGKDAFYKSAHLPLDEALDYLAERLVEVTATEDAVEGITAFIQKRPPLFKGK